MRENYPSKRQTLSKDLGQKTRGSCGVLNPPDFHRSHLPVSAGRPKGWRSGILNRFCAFAASSSMIPVFESLISDMLRQRLLWTFPGNMIFGICHYFDMKIVQPQQSFWHLFDQGTMSR
ncbi:MAG: hypothetical protein LAP21_23025, partial [Acidobacteriia bacterium]|nr:hypothetical protein [Terriglobia bacterium]